MNLLSYVKVANGDGQSAEPLYMMASNISAGGIFLMTDVLLPVDTNVHVGVFLPTQNPLNTPSTKDKIVSLVQTTGRVIRHEDAGMAVRFGKKYRISPLLKKNARKAAPSPLHEHIG
jgi:hypothetical protein